MSAAATAYVPNEKSGTVSIIFAGGIGHRKMGAIQCDDLR